MTGQVKLKHTAQDTTGAAVQRFISDTMISLRGASAVLGVSHSSLFRWVEGTATPMSWSSGTAMRRIEMLRQEDADNGLFTRLTAMSHRDRIAALRAVIAERSNTVDA